VDIVAPKVVVILTLNAGNKGINSQHFDLWFPLAKVDSASNGSVHGYFVIPGQKGRSVT